MRRRHQHRLHKIGGQAEQNNGHRCFEFLLPQECAPLQIQYLLDRAADTLSIDAEQLYRPLVVDLI